MVAVRESGVFRKVLGACGLLGLLGVLCCGGIGLGVHGWHVDQLKALPPYQSLTWVVRDGGTVRRQLGDPVSYGRWVTGKHRERGVEEDLDLRVPVEGPYDLGYLELSAQASDGVWEVTRLELHTESEQGIDLLADMESLERNRLSTVVGELVEEGKSHESVGAHADAVDAYSRALKFDSDAPDALLGRGRARRNLADLDGARQDLERYLRVVPNSETGQLELGQVHAAADRPDLCVEAYTAFLRSQPDDAGAWFHRASCFEALGKARSAAAGAREACRMGHGLACTMSERLSRKR